MASTHKALLEHGIQYWLDYGSLLGAMREGKIIAWDTDLDIGILSSELPKLTKAFELLSPNYSISTCTRDHYYRVNYSKTNLVHCDIWVYHPTNGKLHCKGLGPKEDIEPHWVERFKTRSFVGLECPIPENPEGLLEIRYGERWKIPLRRNWTNK